MRHKGVFALIAAGIGAAAVLVAAPAGAQEPGELPLTVEPTSGGVGTVITVSGADCSSPNPDDAPEVDFVLADEEFIFGPGEGVVADDDVVQAEDDGTWSGQLTVPGDADPDATWFVSALCFASPEAEGVLATYELVEFDVTGPPTTPTTQPPTTLPTAPPPPEAPPAVPVVEEPIFTG
jgi:hypothetical protein